MKWDVYWLPSAEIELARIWNEAIDKVSLSKFANEIDLLLEADPENQGESRGEDFRILIRLPLGILFCLDKIRHLVEVNHIWVIAKGKKS